MSEDKSTVSIKKRNSLKSGHPNFTNDCIPPSITTGNKLSAAAVDGSKDEENSQDENREVNSGSSSVEKLELSLTIPNVVLVGDIITFHCEMSETQEEEFLVTFSRVSDQVQMRKDYAEHTVMPGEKEAHITIVPKAADEGSVVCRAAAQNKTDANASVSEQHYFKVIDPVGSVSLEVSPASGEVLEGNNITLRCAASKGTHLSYTWWLNDTVLKESKPEVFIERITLLDTGTYSCMANNSLNDTVTFTSNRVQKTIKVKEYVSKPEISFVVVKDGREYQASILCESSRGTGPVTFTLYNQTGEVMAMDTDSTLFISFNIPITLGQNMGMIYCGAKNPDQEVFSNTLTLHVVPVGGTVTLKAEYKVGHNFEVVGLTLHCDVEHGTFPNYHWFLNDSELQVESRGTFFSISKERRTLSLTPTDPDSFGSYHCKATDSFDFANTVSSKEFLVDKKALNFIPIEVVALVFGCFLFIVCLLAGCGIYGAIYPIRRPAVKPRFTWDIPEIEIQEYKYEDRFEIDLE